MAKEMSQLLDEWNHCHVARYWRNWSISLLYNRTFNPMESSGLFDIVVKGPFPPYIPLWIYVSGYGRNSTIYGYWLCYKLNYLGKHFNPVGSCLPAGIETEHSVGYNIILSNQLLLDYWAHGKNILWLWLFVCALCRTICPFIRDDV